MNVRRAPLQTPRGAFEVAALAGREAAVLDPVERAATLLQTRAGQRVVGLLHAGAGGVDPAGFFFDADVGALTVDDPFGVGQSDVPLGVSGAVGAIVADFVGLQGHVAAGDRHAAGGHQRVGLLVQRQVRGIDRHFFRVARAGDRGIVPALAFAGDSGGPRAELDRDLAKRRGARDRVTHRLAHGDRDRAVIAGGIDPDDAHQGVGDVDHGGSYDHVARQLKGDLFGEGVADAGRALPHRGGSGTGGAVDDGDSRRGLDGDTGTRRDPSAESHVDGRRVLDRRRGPNAPQRDQHRQPRRRSSPTGLPRHAGAPVPKPSHPCHSGNNRAVVPNSAA